MCMYVGTYVRVYISTNHRNRLSCNLSRNCNCIKVIALFSYTTSAISHAEISVDAILFNCGNNDIKIETYYLTLEPLYLLY